MIVRPRSSQTPGVKDAAVQAEVGNGPEVGLKAKNSPSSPCLCDESVP
jgi:hypothetical protein